MNAPAELPKAVVFDMDGTLLDTETPARIAFARAITDLGFAYQEQSMTAVSTQVMLRLSNFDRSLR